MFVFKAAVVGAGTMGGEIAQIVAAAGIPVVLKDIDQRLVDVGVAKAREVTRGQLDRLVERGKLTAEAADAQYAEILARIVPTTAYDEFGDVDFVIEAVPERMAIKQAVFAELDAATPGHAILASNTSGLSITELGLATTRPERVVGFHFFYPASVMRLVEVIEGEHTSAEAVSVAMAFAQTLRKLPIRCGEVPGFVVNRVLNSAISEVWRLQEERGLSIQAVDRAISGGGVAPIGPFFLTDLLGLDTVHHVAQHLHDSYGDRFYVHRGMGELVAAGELGAKSGRGFYENGEPRSTGVEEVDAQELADRFTLKALVECCLLLEEGVASIRDIDLGMLAGRGSTRRRSRGPTPPAWTSSWRRSSARSKSGARASRRRRFSGGWWPRAGSGPPPARASSPHRDRTPGRTAGSSWRPAPSRGWRSPGSTTRRPTRSRPTSSAPCARPGTPSWPTRGSVR